MAYQISWNYPYSSTQEIYLENRTVGHSKFYEMTHTGSGWTARWGKIGTSGQTRYYDACLWSEKLAEKLVKGYDIIKTVDAVGIIGTPPATVEPRRPDFDTLVDTDKMTKIDRIILFLEEKGKKTDMELAESIKLEYIRIGMLTKRAMQTLNDLWITNGGGRW